ncbi:alpha/beta fold hydrolase [Lichenihabitans psoromatis]|uniref:alpha/beta fold hydrolase n=1 Tax=Lichenihabitans psoromatis TaxID=2528642 RepID=UPI001035BD79|nr:alpha/beta hydrolase [Lichenihabitans psoromatis]
MPDLADLFPGFASRTVATDAGRIFARVGGSGPPLMLLHGFPETMAMWHAIAPDLAKHFTVVAMDLRGYGWSSVPRSQNGEGYAKRVMADDVIAVMDDLGHAQFALAGHDRGARVGYRLALDHPGRLSKLALLDIEPTMEVWRQIEAGSGDAPHWTTLAEPEPRPEQAFGKDPVAAFGGLLVKWSKAKSLAAFDPRALDHYRATWTEPTRIHAMCEDYRAGATLDRAADEADAAAGKTISCPVHILASSDYLQGPGKDAPLDVWRRGFAPQATGETIESGHFLAEENAAATGQALMRFYSA